MTEGEESVADRGIEAPGGFLARPPDPVTVLSLFLLAVFLVLVLGQPVPHSNEHFYLLAPFRLSHPEFLSHEWVFSSPQFEHLLFDGIAGALMAFLPLEAVGWILRFVSWGITVAAIVLLSGSLGVRPWMAAGAIAVWVANGQSVLGGEWILGGAEAKVIAYPLLLLGIHYLLVGRASLAGALVGIGTSFHPLVGIQLGGAAWMGALFLLGWTREMGKFTLLVFLLSLPGVLATFMGASQGDGLSNADWGYLARFALSNHIDPSSFPSRAFVTLAVLTSFNGLVCWVRREEMSFRFFGILHIPLAALLIAGLLAWHLEAYLFLQFMPFRVLPVLAPLLFLLFLATLFHHPPSPASGQCGCWEPGG